MTKEKKVVYLVVAWEPHAGGYPKAIFENRFRADNYALNSNRHSDFERYEVQEMVVE